MRNFINKNSQPNHREKQRGSMVIVCSSHCRVVLLAILMILLMLFFTPFSFASTARNPTLRSRLYEQFRCGNGICDNVETALVCPEDCPGEPEPVNETPVAAPLVEEKKSAGFESISTMVPDDELFEEQPAVFSPQQQRSASSLPVVTLVLLIIAILGIVLYALRNTAPLQRLLGSFRKEQQLPPFLLSSPKQSLQTVYHTQQTAQSTILTGLIQKFTKKGLMPGEIHQRIARMGIWDDDTIRRQLKI